MYYSNNSLLHIDHELEVCMIFRAPPSFDDAVFIVSHLMAIKFYIAAVKKAGGGSITEVKLCQLSIVIGAKLGNPARFSAFKYLI